jgi:hypothetical protein
MGSEGTNSDPRIRFDGEATQAAIVPTLPAGSTTSGASGYLNLGSTTSAFKEIHLTDGVVFPDAGGTNTTTSSNTLDSYEEGTFTPNLTGTGGAFSGASYGTQSGKYTKIGDTVHIQVHLVCSAVTGGSGSLAVGNLPFTIGGACGASIGYVSGLNVDETTFTQFGLYTTTSGGARLIFTKTGDNAAAGEVLISEFTSAFNIVFTATYKV